MEEKVTAENLYEKCIYTEEFVDDEIVKRNSVRRLWYNFRKRKIAVLGLCIVFLFILVAIFADQLAPCDPYEQNLANSNLSPSQAAERGLNHLLGTDESGRDLLSRNIIFLHGFYRYGQLRRPYLLSVMLHPAGSGKVLPQFPLRRAAGLSPFIK